MSLYCGINLHSNNCYLAVLDEQLRPVLGRRVANSLETILAALGPHQEQLAAVAVESTFNWYWLVDGLMEGGYHVELVNTSAVRQYEGLKYVDDRHDARWLARLLPLRHPADGLHLPERTACPARPPAQALLPGAPAHRQPAQSPRTCTPARPELRCPPRTSSA